MGIITQKKISVPLNLLLLYLLLLTGIIVSSLYFYNYQKRIVRQDAENLFMFISNLKSNQLVEWRKERIADAEEIFFNVYVKESINRFLIDTSNITLKNEVHSWIETLLLNSNYKSVALLNKDLKIVFQFRTKVSGIDTVIKEMCKNSLLTGKTVLSDFYRDAQNNELYMELLIPVFAMNNRKCLVLIRINPYATLFNTLKEWPAKTSTAETLLLKKENDSVLYLNQPRFFHNPAIMLKYPLHNNKIAAARYLNGETGVLSAKDYAGNDVISYGRKVPGTEWYLMTKINTDELYENINYHLNYIILASVLFLLVITTFFWYFLKKQILYYHELLYRSDEDKKTLEQNYEFLINNANDIMFLLDDTGNIIFSNKRACQVYGYTQEEFLKLNVHDIRAQSSLDLIKEQMKIASEPGGIVFESIHRRKDKTDFPVEVSSRAIIIRDKKYLQSIIRDITDRKESERKIFEVNRTYSLLSDVNQMIVRTDKEEKLFEETCKVAVKSGGFKFSWIGIINRVTGNLQVAAKAGECNEAFDEICLKSGNKDSNFIPSFKSIETNSMVIVNDIENDKCMEDCREKAKQNNFKSCAVFPIHSNNKIIGVINFYSEEKNFFTEAEIKLLEELSGDVSYAIKYLKNDKKRKRSEKALLKSWERYKELFENNPGLMWIYDEMTLKFVDVNKTSIKHYGYSRDEFLSMTIKEIVVPEDVDKLMSMIDLKRDEEIRIIYNIKHKKKDGTVICVETKSNPVPSIKNQHLRIVSIADVTEQVRMIEEVTDAKEKAEEANKARNVFLGTMSHELRTPLIGILGYADMLTEDINNPEQAEMANGIKRGGKRLLNTLNLILDFTRIESDRLEVSLKNTDIAEPLMYAFKEFEGITLDKNLEYKLEFLQSNLLTDIDEHLFIIIIENLINNAVKFTKKGGIYICAGRTENNRVYVKVRDTGIGIDEKHLSVIFQEFRQVSEGINREYQGTGLGLTITDKYIKLLNGKIEVESKIGEGTAFTISFPGVYNNN